MTTLLALGSIPESASFVTETWTKGISQPPSRYGWQYNVTEIPLAGRIPVQSDDPPTLSGGRGLEMGIILLGTRMVERSTRDQHGALWTPNLLQTSRPDYLPEASPRAAPSAHQLHNIV